MNISTIKYHKDRTLPENKEVWVFGSNLAGIHGAGAAKIAASKFGAQYGKGIGWQPDFKSYAIPTKDNNIRTLSLNEVVQYINDFIRVTNDDFMVFNKILPQYFVTRIGCGLAGFKDEEIAPLFKGARNCSFAKEWKQYLE